MTDQRDSGKPGPKPSAAQQAQQLAGDTEAVASALHQTAHMLIGVAAENRGYDGAQAHMLSVASAARALVMASVCGAKDGEERKVFENAIKLAQESFEAETALRSAATERGSFMSHEVGQA